MYEHRYKHGKQKQIMPLAAFQAVMQEAVNREESLEHLAFVIFTHYFGNRKSEGYERLISDATLTEKFVIVDFHTRKKNGLKEEPNETPREWWGVEEFLVPWVKERQKAKATKKRIFYQQETGEYRQTAPTPRFPQGMRVSVKKRVSKVVKDVWLFPNVASTSAWSLYKRIYGEEYYPHYDRLWRLSKAGQTADNPVDAFAAIQRVSGLRTWDAAQAYMGRTKKVEQDAMHTLKE